MQGSLPAQCPTLGRFLFRWEPELQNVTCHRHLVADFGVANERLQKKTVCKKACFDLLK